MKKINDLPVFESARRSARISMVKIISRPAACLRKTMLSLLLLTLINSAFCSDSTAYGLRTFIYKKAGNTELKLDVFTPANSATSKKSFPAIILFHGGSWISGERSYMNWQCRYFVQQGLVAITADYRFANEEGKKICIKDAKSAVRWVKRHEGLLHIDSAKIILGGGSAGGHLAIMAALNSSLNDASDDTTISTTANALVLFNPAYNLDEDPVVEPYSFVRPGIPPTIMFFGSKDKWKPPADSLFALLKKNNVACEMWVANGEKHAFFNKAPWNLATCIKAQAFLVKYGLLNNYSLSAPAGELVKEL